MKQVQGWYLPDTDTDFDRWILNGEYQKEHRDTIIKFLKRQGVQFENCIDVGAHVGFWLKDLCNNFKNVFAFEPISDVRECLEKNVTAKNYTLFPFALGNDTKIVNVNYMPEQTGNTYISDEGNREIELKMLDNLILPKIDYIKIDAEGFEMEVIKGGLILVERDKPYIHVEVKGKVLEKHGLIPNDIDKFFIELGYELKLRFKSENVYGPK